MESYMHTRHFPSTRPPSWLHDYQDHINLCGEQLERFIKAMKHLKKQVGPLWITAYVRGGHRTSIPTSTYVDGN